MNTNSGMEYRNPYTELCIENRGGLFRTLPSKDKETLCDSSSVLAYKKGELIAREGTRPSGLLCLAAGKVKVFREGVGGRDQIIRLVRANEFIGLPAMFAEKFYYANATAFDDCTAIQFDRSNFLKVVKRNGEFAVKLMKLFAQEVVTSNTRLISLTQKHVRGRVAESLIMLRDTYGFEADGITLSAYFSREDLAGLSNMTTSNAIRTLSHFATEGIIALDGKKIRIKDNLQLERISELG